MPQLLHILLVLIPAVVQETLIFQLPHPPGKEGRRRRGEMEEGGRGERKDEFSDKQGKQVGRSRPKNTGRGRNSLLKKGATYKEDDQRQCSCNLLCQTEN